MKNNILVNLAVIGIVIGLTVVSLVYYVALGVSDHTRLLERYECTKRSESDKEHCGSTAVADFVDGEYEQCIKCWTRQTSTYHKDVVDEKELARWKFYTKHTARKEMADKTITQLDNDLIIYLWSPLCTMILLVLLVWVVYGLNIEGGFSSFTGPRGGQYRMSGSGMSKVYITRS
jgi:hypothetical protein